MRTVIYLDVLLLVNFVVGAAFLLAAGLLCGACCSPLRLVGGAGAAAVSSLALLAPTAPWPLALTYKGMSAALCVAAAYGWQGARNTARLTAWFVLLNLTLTGALFLPGAACNNLSFYLPVSPGLLLASTAGVCGVVEGVLHVLGRSGPACFGAELSVAGRVVPLSVFCDTGFHVQEPLSGRAVVLVRLDAVSLPPGVRAYLDACLAGVGAEPRPEWGVRFVPCQTVAGHCLLPALPAALASNGRKQDEIYAAFCDMPPPPGGMDGSRQRGNGGAAGQMTIQWEEYTCVSTVCRSFAAPLGQTELDGRRTLSERRAGSAAAPDPGGGESPSGPDGRRRPRRPG